MLTEQLSTQVTFAQLCTGLGDAASARTANTLASAMRAELARRAR